MEGGLQPGLTPAAANLQQYIQAVEQFPVLDAEEERRLAEQFRRENDIRAAWRLVTSHLRYVVNIARGYKGYGLPQEDLIQEGNIGLMHAVRKFDPSRGVRLLAYAVFWIRSHIHDYILRNWRIVRIATTKARRKLFYKLRSTKRRLEWLNQDEADEVAEALGVSSDDVIDMDSRMYSKDSSFDTSELDDDEWAPADWLADELNVPERVVSSEQFREISYQALNEAFAELDNREHEIIRQRWLNHHQPATLQALADQFGVSAERVRQIESKAIAQLRASVLRRMSADWPALSVPTPGAKPTIPLPGREQQADGLGVWGPR